MASVRGKGRKPLERHRESTWAASTVEYAAWTRMIRRCENPRHRAYPYYGGRGIRVCARWRASYAAFLADMGRRPSPRHQLDRIDNEGHYEPGNVRWATREEQQRNTRATRWVVVHGERLALSDAVERYAVVQKKTVEQRLATGWNDHQAVTAPLHARRKRCIGEG